MARWKLTEPEIRSRVSDFEFAWLIGLLEGEGSFAYSGGDNTKSGSQGVRLDMTDEDVVYKAAALIERLTDSHISISCRDNSAKTNWKDSFYFQIYGTRARMLMKLMVKHMSWRRRQQIWLALNRRSVKTALRRQTGVINLVELGLLKKKESA